jgi:hypothetical protein
MTIKTPRLDRERCKQLLSRSPDCTMVPAALRRQLRAALLELARMAAANDRLHMELALLHRDHDRVMPAADALLHETRTHSNQCVCPLCRSVRGYREIIAGLVAQYRAANSGGGS